MTCYLCEECYNTSITIIDEYGDEQTSQCDIYSSKIFDEYHGKKEVYFCSNKCKKIFDFSNKKNTNSINDDERCIICSWFNSSDIKLVEGYVICTNKGYRRYSCLEKYQLMKRYGLSLTTNLEDEDCDDIINKQCLPDTLIDKFNPNIEKRVKEHNTSIRGAKSIKGKLPVKLVYKESLENLGKALKREREIKGWRKDKKENLIALALMSVAKKRV